jgi:hypothetical protein
VEGTRPRGFTGLAGATAAQIAVKRAVGDYVDVTLEFAKDMKGGLCLNSRLDTVKIGTDQDGDDITSCVVTATGELSYDKPAAKKTESFVAKQFVAAYQAARNEHEEEKLIDGILLAVVERRHVEKAFMRIHKPNYRSENPIQQQKANTKRKDFERVLSKLPQSYKLKILANGNTYIWRTS